MDLNQLEYFVTVINEGTISSAARKLNLSQPPLSAQMKSLEQEIGSQLFFRGPRQIELTEAGRILYERSKDILDLSSRTLQELSDYREGKSGVLRIGIVSSAHDLMAQRAFRPFHEQFPEIRFELYENDTYRVIKQLQSKVLDLAIVRTPFQSDNLTCYTLVKEHLLAVGNKKYFSSDTSYNTKHTLSTDRKIATAEPDQNVTISLKELAEHPLIVYHRWLPVLDQHFETLKLQPNYLCINHDSRTGTAWAKAGMGIAILPASAAESLTSKNIIKKVITDPVITSDICILHHPDGYLSKIGTSFLMHMMNYFGISH